MLQQGQENSDRTGEPWNSGTDLSCTWYCSREFLYEEEFPLILDDTFGFYDEKRLANTLQWLAENKKQVLIFTCQKREEELLKKMHIPYNKENV